MYKLACTNHNLTVIIMMFLGLSTRVEIKKILFSKIPNRLGNFITVVLFLDTGKQSMMLNELYLGTMWTTGINTKIYERVNPISSCVFSYFDVFTTQLLNIFPAMSIYLPASNGSYSGQMEYSGQTVLLYWYNNM